MSDVSVQLYAFAVCMLAGALGGVLYEGASLVRFFTGNRAARAAADAVFLPRLHARGVRRWFWAVS